MPATSKMRNVFHALFAALCTVLVLSSALAAADAQARSTTYELDIPAQDLNTTLQAVALASQHKLLYRSALVEGKTSRALKGKYTTREAMEALLSGTELTFEITPSAVVLIRAKGSSRVDGVEGSEATQQLPARAISDPVDRTPNMRLAQAESSTQTPSTRSEERSARSSNNGVELGEIVVTGTHIRGVANVGAPLIEISREDIDRSGYATTPEVVESLPQNFSGGASEDTTGRGGGFNIGFGTGVNLRGLGNDSTLVLLDGRRIAPSGGQADFVDVSMIPLTAIERIEVLTDGASALYGSDAVGGVINFIMRKDYEGAESRIRYGSVTRDDVTELQFAQVLGTSWTGGNTLFAYEYNNRGNLASEDRAFTADSDLTRFGGDNARDLGSNPGNVTLDFAEFFAIPTGQDGMDLTPDELLPGVINLQNTREKTDVLPEQTRHSAFLTASHMLTDSMRLFGDARYSRRDFEHRFTAASDFLFVPSTNPFYVDPIGGTDGVFVVYSFIDDLGPQRESGEVESYNGTLGATLKLGGSWQAQLYGAYSAEQTHFHLSNVFNVPALFAALEDSNPATAFNPFGDGSNTPPATIDAIQGFENQDTDSDLWMIHAKVDGNLFAVPGGTAKLAVGAEYRAESLEFGILDFIGGAVPTGRAFPGGDREVYAGFAELYIPFVTSENDRPGLRRFEVSVAGRHENYSDFGSTTDPRLGLLWAPVDGLFVRGTIGTSFKAPLLSQLQSTKTIFLLPLPDPQSASGFTNTLLLLGTKDGLEPEEATTWTAGLQLRPPGIEGLNVALNYFDADIDGRIRTPAVNIGLIFRDEETFAQIITRNPSVDAVNALFNDPDFRSSPIPPEQVGAIVDDRRNNVAVTEVQGLDLSLSYGFESRVGAFDLEFSGSYLIDLKLGLTSTAPPLEQVDTITNPVDLRLRSGIFWRRGRWSAATFVNYVDGYTDNLSDPGREIDSWTTVDLQIAYSTGDRVGLLAGLNVSVNVQNLFDEDPPFANVVDVGYDGINSNPLGRFIALQATKQW